jgi:hypothetical protein
VLQQTKVALEKRQGVQAVHVNQAAGSLTVHYDPDHHPGNSIIRLLEDLDVIVGTGLDLPRIEGSGRLYENSSVATTLGAALDDLDHQIASLTGATVDLRTLFPLSLAGIGIWLIRENGLMLDAAPGWLFLWLAFDAFVRLHPHAPATSSAFAPVSANAPRRTAQQKPPGTG